MAHSSGSECELESKISEMSNYLDSLILGEEKGFHFDPDPNPESASCSGMEAGETDFNRRTPPLWYIPSLSPTVNPINIFPQNNPMASSQFALTNVTSALASRITTCSSTLRFVNPPPNPRARKWGNYKHAENEPDTSDIDINETMAELGLTPQSLTNNEVHRLFSTYNKLAFYIHADYVFENIYEAKTLPNTMSVSVQTRHAIWSTNKLLRQFRDVLKDYVNIPPEYQGPLDEFRRSFEDLHMAIMKLETFKFCVLEHRKGKFISVEARENLEPLIETLNQLIECVGISRMYFKVIDWALNKRQQRIDVISDGSCAGPSQQLTDNDTLESLIKGRPAAARRYIG